MMKKVRIELFDQLAVKDVDSFAVPSKSTQFEISSALKQTLSVSEVAAVAKGEKTESVMLYLSSDKDTNGHISFSINKANIKGETLGDLYNREFPKNSNVPDLGFGSDSYWWKPGEEHMLGSEFLKYAFDLFVMTALGIFTYGTLDERQCLADYIHKNYKMNKVIDMKCADNLGQPTKTLFLNIGKVIYEWVKKPTFNDCKIDNILAGEIKVALFFEDKHGKK